MKGTSEEEKEAMNPKPPTKSHKASMLGGHRLDEYSGRCFRPCFWGRFLVKVFLFTLPGAPVGFCL